MTCFRFVIKIREKFTYYIIHINIYRGLYATITVVIAHAKQQEVHFLIKCMVYAEMAEHLEECYQAFTSSSDVIVPTIGYVQKLYQCKEKWALAFRGNMLTRN